MATPIPRNEASFNLAELLQVTGGEARGADDALVVCGVFTDSRACQRGGLFVALRGENFDGQDYLSQVAAGGAVAALVHEGAPAIDGLNCVVVEDTTRALGLLARHHRRRFDLHMLAVTGSAGKTTTRELLATGMEAAGYSVLRTLGNLNNQIGVPMMLLQLDSGHDAAVLELGTSMPGEIALLASLVEPDVALVLGASEAHTEGLGDLEGVVQEKTSLWQALGSAGVAVGNADDPGVAAALAGLQGRRRLRFGCADGADVRLTNVRLGRGGGHLSLQLGGDLAPVDVALCLLGEAAALDCAAAVACLLALPGDDVARRLAKATTAMSTLRPVPGRMAGQPWGASGFVIDDTYNANPSSMRMSLDALVRIASDSSASAVAVLGDMGELASPEQEHRAIGTLCVQLGVDLLVGVGEHMVHATRAAAGAAGGRLAAHPTRVIHLRDASAAAESVLRLAPPEATVLVKGSRSMAMERVVHALLCGASP